MQSSGSWCPSACTFTPWLRRLFLVQSELPYEPSPPASEGLAPAFAGAGVAEEEEEEGEEEEGLEERSSTVNAGVSGRAGLAPPCAHCCGGRLLCRTANRIDSFPL